MLFWSGSSAACAAFGAEHGSEFALGKDDQKHKHQGQNGIKSEGQ